MTEDEMVGWYHQLIELEFKQVPGVGDGQGGLACCGPLRHGKSDTNERLSWLTDCKNSKDICQVPRGY